MAYQSKSYSLSDEAIARIEALVAVYGSANKGFLAVLPASGLSQDGRTISSPVFNATTASVNFDPASIPGVAAGVSVAPKATARCEHCGKMRAAKRTTLCSVLKPGDKKKARANEIKG